MKSLCLLFFLLLTAPAHSQPKITVQADITAPYPGQHIHLTVTAWDTSPVVMSLGSNAETDNAMWQHFTLVEQAFTLPRWLSHPWTQASSFQRLSPQAQWLTEGRITLAAPSQAGEYTLLPLPLLLNNQRIKASLSVPITVVDTHAEGHTVASFIDATESSLPFSSTLMVFLTLVIIVSQPLAIALLGYGSSTHTSPCPDTTMSSPEQLLSHLQQQGRMDWSALWHHIAATHNDALIADYHAARYASTPAATDFETLCLACMREDHAI